METVPAGDMGHGKRKERLVRIQSMQQRESLLCAWLARQEAQQTHKQQAEGAVSNEQQARMSHVQNKDRDREGERAKRERRETGAASQRDQQEGYGYLERCTEYLSQNEGVG